MVKNAGTAEPKSSISTFAKFLSIRTPTKISAGAVAAEGMMLAILLMNTFAPLIDHYVIEGSIKRRAKKVKIA